MGLRQGVHRHGLGLHCGQVRGGVREAAGRIRGLRTGRGRGQRHRRPAHGSAPGRGPPERRGGHARPDLRGHGQRRCLRGRGPPLHRLRGAHPGPGSGCPGRPPGRGRRGPRGGRLQPGDRPPHPGRRAHAHLRPPRGPGRAHGGCRKVDHPGGRGLGRVPGLVLQGKAYRYLRQARHPELQRQQDHYHGRVVGPS